jgi:hypothetical protein
MMEDYDTPEWGNCDDCGAHYEGLGEKPPCKKGCRYYDGDECNAE